MLFDQQIDLGQVCKKDRPRYTAYIALQSAKSGPLNDQRNHILSMWQRFEPYAGRDFVQKFPQETSERYWEMLVGTTLLDAGMNLCPCWKGGTKKWGGLDFKVDLAEGGVLWVECTTFSMGHPEKADAKALNPDSYPPPHFIEEITRRDCERSEIESITYIPGGALENIQLRIATVFENKISHAQKKRVCGSDPVIVAIGNADVPPTIVDDHLGHFLKVSELFLPIRDTGVVDLDSGTVLVEHSELQKGDSPVKKPFVMDNAELVSGVIFSTRSLPNRGVPWDDGLYWIENPWAENTIDLTDTLTALDRIRAERNEEEGIILSCDPSVKA